MINVKKRYLQQVKQLLPYDAGQKKHCVDELDHSVDIFLKDNPDATLETIYHKFGHPEDIASSYLERVDPTKLSKSTTQKRRLIVGVLSALVIIAIIIGVSTAAYLKKVDDYHEGYYVDTYEELPSVVSPPPSPIVVY